MNCSPPERLAGERAWPESRSRTRHCSSVSPGVHERVLAGAHLAEHPGRVNQEASRPPQGQPLQEGAGLQGVFEVAERPLLVFDLHEECAEMPDIVDDRGEVLGGFPGAAFFEAGVVRLRARAVHDRIEVTHFGVGVEPSADRRQRRACRIRPRGSRVRLLAGGSRQILGHGSERVDMRLQRLGFVRRRGAGDVGGDLKVPGRIDDQKAVFLKLVNQCRRRFVDLDRPAFRQCRPLLVEGVDVVAQACSLGRTLREDSLAALRGGDLIGDGVRVHLLQVGRVGGQLDAGPKRLGHRCNRVMQLGQGVSSRLARRLGQPVGARGCCAGSGRLR